MEITISWIFGIIASGAIAFVSWSLKELYKQLKSDKEETRLRIIELESRIDKNYEKIETKIYNVENKLAENYVAKADFYREINKIDMKLDSIGEKISTVNENVSELIGKEKKKND